MKVSDGRESLEIERHKALFQVRLTSSQVNEEGLKEIADRLNIQQEDESWLISYTIPAKVKSLASAIGKTKTRIDRLELAQKLTTLADLEDNFKIPFLHPENILVAGDRLTVVHFGLRQLLAPQALDDAEFLNAYKALVLNIVNPKVSFESLSDGSLVMTDKLSQTINAFESVDEIADFVDQELEAEVAKAKQKLTAVPKGRYRFFKYFGIVAIVAALVLGWFTFSYYSNSQKQNAIITAQTDFLTDNYAKTQTDLQHYSPSALPQSALYILAVSSVNLSDLTITQKQAILNTISTKSDDNTLNYWVYTGRGDFNQALNLAQNLGDDQLTLLAYTNLYETTKLNTTMNGADKQKLLNQYNQEIQQLTKSLGQ